MKANSYVTSSALKKVLHAPALQGLTPAQDIHHSGPVYVVSLKQTESLRYLLGVLDNWDQTHGLINKVSGATNKKFPNIKVAFLKMPDLLADFKTKYDEALQRHNTANAAKVKAAKRKRMTQFASSPAFRPDEDGFLIAAEDNQDDNDDDATDDSSSLTSPPDISSPTASLSGGTSSGALHSSL
eukprot:2795555-Ditylum_brightwellii.AAC.1